MKNVMIAILLTAAPVSASSQKGQAALDAYQFCLAEATKQCGRNSIRCNAFRRSFVKVCMMQAGIEPEYIELMLQN